MPQPVPRWSENRPTPAPTEPTPAETSGRQEREPAPAQLMTRLDNPKPAPSQPTTPSKANKPATPEADFPSITAEPARPSSAVTPHAADEVETLDLEGLTQQLKETKAIGLWTKLSLKNQVDDLMEEFRKFYAGESKRTLMELRQSYNLLIMKVLSLIQDDDQKLAAAIVSSREPIWELLADPKSFAALKV